MTGGEVKFHRSFYFIMQSLMQTEFQCHISFRFQREILRIFLYTNFVFPFLKGQPTSNFQTVSIIEALAKQER